MVTQKITSSGQGNQGTSEKNGILPLGSHLLKMAGFLLLLFVVCFVFAGQIYELLVLPYKNMMINRYGEDHIGEISRLYFTSPQQLFMVYLKLAFIVAFFLLFPFMAAQFYCYLTSGSYSLKHKNFLPFFVLSAILFWIGVALIYFWVVPYALAHFAPMGKEDLLRPGILPKASDYILLVLEFMFLAGAFVQLILLPFVPVLKRGGFIEVVSREKSRVLIQETDQ